MSAAVSIGACCSGMQSIAPERPVPRSSMSTRRAFGAMAQTASDMHRANHSRGSLGRPRPPPAYRLQARGPNAGNTQNRCRPCLAPTRPYRVDATGAHTRERVCRSAAAACHRPAARRVRPPPPARTCQPIAEPADRAAAGGRRAGAGDDVHAGEVASAMRACAAHTGGEANHVLSTTVSCHRLGAAGSARIPLGRARSGAHRAQDAQRRADRQRRLALAGDLHRRRSAAAQPAEWRYLGQGTGPAARLLAGQCRGSSQALFPFLWGTVAAHGQLFGNRTKGSDAHVTNGMAFSYPGYNEMLERISRLAHRLPMSSAPIRIPTVFEWLNGLPDLRGQVTVTDLGHLQGHLQRRTQPPAAADGLGCALCRQAHAARRAHESPVSRPPPASMTRTSTTPSCRCRCWIRCARSIRACCSSATARPTTGRTRAATTWCCDSAHRFRSLRRRALEHHAGHAAATADSTTFIITRDHGRGSGPAQWKEHGVEEKGSENIWIAVMGPDTPPLGERVQIAR